MTKHLTVALALLLIGLLVGCNDQQSQHSKLNVVDGNYVKVKVDVEAGLPIDADGHFPFPTFFNVGKLDSDVMDISALVLGSRISRNTSINVAPVAVFSFDIDTLNVRYLVGLQETSSEDFGKDYISFMSKNNELVSAIESWFKAQCGFTICRDYKWQNPHRLLLELQNN